VSNAGGTNAVYCGVFVACAEEYCAGGEGGEEPFFCAEEDLGCRGGGGDGDRGGRVAGEEKGRSRVPLEGDRIVSITVDMLGSLGLVGIGDLGRKGG
jgi:hypothetical protein